MRRKLERADSTVNMQETLPNTLSDWLTELLGQWQMVRQLAGGKNNQVYLLATKRRQVVLKRYFHEGSRCRQEIDFLTLMGKFSIDNVPQLHGFNEPLKAAVFSFVAGQPPGQSSQKLVLEAAEWVRQINHPEIQKEAKSLSLMEARGALRLPADFIQELRRRLHTINPGEPATDIDKAFQTFYFNRLLPAVAKVELLFEQVRWQHESLPVCLSPSDFGFHNTLYGERLCFIDFEYAGWDSKDKLLNDFFAQPRYTIDFSLYERFIETAFPDEEQSLFMERAKILFPATMLKWTMIFLNHFNVMMQEKRKFASTGYDEIAEKTQQLNKAGKYLDSVLALL